MNDINGVGTSYSSFVPSRRNAKNIDVTICYRCRWSSLGGGQPPPKFAIRSFVVRRTTNEQRNSSLASGVLGHSHHRLRGGPLARLHSEIVGHQMPRRGRLLAVGHDRIGALLDGGNQVVLDPEHDV